MTQSLTSRYAEVIEQSFVPCAAWTWPRQRCTGEPTPDSRLLDRNISALRADVTLRNGVTVAAQVRAVSQHDLVLNVSDLSAIPVMGQVVEVSVQWDEWSIVKSAKAIVHWSGSVYGRGVVAMFMIESMGKAVKQWLNDNSRGEIRFPVDLPAAIEVSKDKDVFGRIVDYSLSGCRFLAEETVELDVDYPLTVLLSNSSVEVTLRPRWVLNTDAGHQMGCTFEPEQGVLLACRHHPQPTGLSCPLRPQISNWTRSGTDDEDSWGQD